MRNLLCMLVLAAPLTASAGTGVQRGRGVNMPHEDANLKAGSSATRSGRFVGVTSERFTGSGTRAAMTRACSLQFRSARMAFSDEYALSFNPAPVPEAAWVQPRLAFGQFNPGTPPFFYDQAGNRVFPELSCGYWTSDVGLGTVLLPSGALSDVSIGEPCSTAHPVACVAVDTNH
jgi:hypothetical protein